ncbi:hypothetical protein GCM10027074_16140 [Streptomyces deserti]
MPPHAHRGRKSRARGLFGSLSTRAGATLCAPDAPLVLEPPGAAEPVVSVAVEARKATDTGRLASALARLAEEVPSLVVRTDPETGQTVLSGMGELHLEVAVEKLRRHQGLDVNVGRPRVSYRETVARGVTGLVHRHVKQDGEAGQFAQVVLDVEPLGAAEEGATGFEFRSTVVGGRVPQEYVRAVEAGCRDALAEGPLGGHPVTGLRVTLTDGATHVKDSSETAFRAAGRFGLREALRACSMVLLEPVVEVTVTVPEDAVGGVLGDLAARRGRVTGSVTLGHMRRRGGRHRDRAAGRAVRLRDPPAQPDPGPRHVHGAADGVRCGAARDTDAVAGRGGPTRYEGWGRPGGTELRIRGRSRRGPVQGRVRAAPPRAPPTCRSAPSGTNPGPWPVSVAASASASAQVSLPAPKPVAPLAPRCQARRHAHLHRLRRHHPRPPRHRRRPGAGLPARGADAGLRVPG